MQYMGKNLRSGGVPSMYDKSTNVGGIHKQTGLFLAKVMNIVDDRYNYLIDSIYYFYEESVGR